MFAVIFICGNLFLQIAGKIAKIAKIRTGKNFAPHASFNKFKTEPPRRASDSSFSVLHNNVRSLRRNLENFQVHLLDD